MSSGNWKSTLFVHANYSAKTGGIKAIVRSVCHSVISSVCEQANPRKRLRTSTKHGRHRQGVSDALEVLMRVQMWMWDQFFIFLNTGRYTYNVLRYTDVDQAANCSGLIRVTEWVCSFLTAHQHKNAIYTTYVQSAHGDNTTTLTEFALSECFVNPVAWTVYLVN